MWRRTLDGWAYSPLDQVTSENVGELRLVWSRGMSEGRQQGDAARLRRRDVPAERERRTSRRSMRKRAN